MGYLLLKKEKKSLPLSAFVEDKVGCFGCLLRIEFRNVFRSLLAVDLILF